MNIEQLTQELVTGNLENEKILANTELSAPKRILPEANVIKIGGQSFIDRGKQAVFPLIEELKENLPHHKMIIGTGAGTRARHAYSVGVDQGMPTGVLGLLGTFVSIQNAKMIHYLLADHGIPTSNPADSPNFHFIWPRETPLSFLECHPIPIGNAVPK